MPDMDILIDISEFYDVDLREILDGERKKEQMDKVMKETVLKVADFENEEKSEAYEKNESFICRSTCTYDSFVWNHLLKPVGRPRS